MLYSAVSERRALSSASAKRSTPRAAPAPLARRMHERSSVAAMPSLVTAYMPSRSWASPAMAISPLKPEMRSPIFSEAAISRATRRASSKRRSFISTHTRRPSRSLPYSSR